MDWADDVAYSVHDVEDGVHGGYLSLRPLLPTRPNAPSSAPTWPPPTPTSTPTPSPRPSTSCWPTRPWSPRRRLRRHLHRAQIALKRMTSVLTGRFVASAVGATQSRYGTDPVRRYDADLIVPRTVRNQCALLKGMALRYVMRSRAAEDWYEQQRDHPGRTGRRARGVPPRRWTRSSGRCTTPRRVTPRHCAW